MDGGREHEAPMPDALAYFLTWATYGTWLPGDERGWVEYGRGWQLPNPARKLEAEAIMTEEACRLDREQREVVERQVAETCQIRGWKLHAVNCRSNHLHVVVTANVAPKTVRIQLKAWCTRRLKDMEGTRLQTLIRSVSEGVLSGRKVAVIRENWWAERGSMRWINDLRSLEDAIAYVRDGQDMPKPH